MNTIDGATVAQAYTTGALPNAAEGREQSTGDATGTGAGNPTAGAHAAGAQPGAGKQHAAGAPATNAGAADPATMNLESLAAAAGMDPDELLAQVKSGQGITDLLGRTGQLGYGSTVGDSVRGGIVLDLYA